MCYPLRGGVCGGQDRKNVRFQCHCGCQSPSLHCRSRIDIFSRLTRIVSVLIPHFGSERSVPLRCVASPGRSCAGAVDVGVNVQNGCLMQLCVEFCNTSGSNTFAGTSQPEEQRTPFFTILSLHRTRAVGVNRRILYLFPLMHDAKFQRAFAPISTMPVRKDLILCHEAEDHRHKLSLTSNSLSANATLCNILQLQSCVLYHHSKAKGHNLPRWLWTILGIRGLSTSPSVVTAGKVAASTVEHPASKLFSSACPSSPSPAPTTP